MILKPNPNGSSPSPTIKMASTEQIERKKKLEFKTLQLKVSDKLSRENLSNLKHLVMDEIAKVRLEEVTDGIGLFAALEEKGLIKVDDVSLFKDLLETIERMDLCEMVREYEERGTISKKDKKISQMADLDFVKLKAIALEVGKDWRMLGRHLGVPEHEIQQIYQEYRYDLHESSLQVLMRWKDVSGQAATVDALKRALKDMKLMAIIHKHFV